MFSCLSFPFTTHFMTQQWIILYIERKRSNTKNGGMGSHSALWSPSLSILLISGNCPVGRTVGDCQTAFFSTVINASLWPCVRSTSKPLLTPNTASCVGLGVLTAPLRGQMVITPGEQINNPSLHPHALICSSRCHPSAIRDGPTHMTAQSWAVLFCRDKSMILIQSVMVCGGSGFVCIGGQMS